MEIARAQDAPEGISQVLEAVGSWESRDRLWTLWRVPQSIERSRDRGSMLRALGTSDEVAMARRAARPEQ